MVSETGNNNNHQNLNNSSVQFIEKTRKINEKYSLIALFCLIVAILLISFDLKLAAGCLVIIGASLGIMAYRKSSELNKQFRGSLSEFSLMSGKKDDVITEFSHKIREPLNNLVIITDMLIASGLQNKQKELLETFIASTNNMVTILNELSMQSAGNFSLETRKAIRFNLVSTLQNTFDLYSLKDKASLDFILNRKELRNSEFYGDPIIIKQIFLDLFNTIENQASEKAITVTINLKKTGESITESTISFRIQIDKNITLINENSTEKSLAAKLISYGKGTYNQEYGQNHTILTFTLSLSNPVPEPRQKAASMKMEELIPKEKIHKELKELKILLVEDNLINQKITLLTLSPLVSNIETASNGKEALDKFGTTNFDLILMDVQMPVMSGLVAAEKIRALEATTNSHVPIIAITANAMIGDLEKCLSSGMDDYISKPFQPSALLEKIKKFI